MFFRAKPMPLNTLTPETVAGLHNIIMSLPDAQKRDIVAMIMRPYSWPKMFGTFRDLIINAATAQQVDIEALREFGHHCSRLADAMEVHGTDLDVSQSYHVMGHRP